MVKREDIRAMQDAWRAYLDLALGFTDASRKQAMKVAQRLVGKGEATAEQLQSMAEDLVKTSLANRESLVRLVRAELDRALSRVGLATAEEVADLTSRVRDLEQRLRVAEVPVAEPAAAEPAAPPVKAVPPVPPKAAKKLAKAAPPVPPKAAKKLAKKAVVKKTVAKKAAAS